MTHDSTHEIHECFVLLLSLTIIQLGSHHRTYKLSVKNLKDGYQQSVIIHTFFRKASIFIQTDKAIYKPGDVVKYRVLVVDPESKPYQYNSMTIKILDETEEAFYNESYEPSIDEMDEMLQEREFEISENSFFGIWSIVVQINNDIESLTKQTFEVKEYVLPRFEVFIETKTKIVDEPDLNLLVYAKYNFGELVNGRAKIDVKKCDSKFPDKIQKEFTNFYNISLKENVIFSLKNDLDIDTVIRPIIITVEVEFEEELTRRKMYVNETITVGNSGGFEIIVNRPRLKIKPGFDYEINVLVRDPYGKVVTGKNSLSLDVKLYFDNPKCVAIEDANNSFDQYTRKLKKFLQKGQADFTIAVPQNTSEMSLTLKYMDVERTINVTRFPSFSREYLLANVLTKK